MQHTIPPLPGDMAAGDDDELWLINNKALFSDDPLLPSDDTSTSYDELLERFRKRLEETDRSKDPPLYSISDKDKQRLFPTPDLVHAFDNVTATTWPAAQAVSHKKRVVAEIQNHRPIPDDILRLPTIYVGAGADLEYPLCLGCRHLIMVDPNDRLLTVEEVQKRIKRITGREPGIPQDGALSFLFDFGEGPETVRVQIEHAWYNPTGGDAHRTPVFSPPEKIGMVLGYQTVGVELDPDNIVARIVPGGAIFVNKLLGSVTKRLTEAERKIVYCCDKHSAEERLTLLTKKHAERGFRYMPVNFEADERDTIAFKADDADADPTT